MDDKDLNSLKDIDIPEPSADAKARAFKLSMAAFEDAGKNNSYATQGSEAATRLTTTFIQATWEWIMDKRMLMGTVAAGLLVAPIATHLMWNTGTLKLEHLTSGDEIQEVLQDTTTSGTRGEKTSEEFGRLGNEQVAATPPVDQEAKPDSSSNAPAPVAKTDTFDAVRTLPELAAPPVDHKAKPDSNANAPAPEARTDDDTGALDLVELLKKSAKPQVQPKPESDVVGGAPAASSEAEPALTAEVKPAETPARKAEPSLNSNGALQQFSLDAQPTQKRAAKQRTQSVTGLVGTYRQESESRILPTPPPTEQNRDKFQEAQDNPVKSVQSEPVSTFSIDVDTASYAFVRRTLESGALPPKNSVRVEEMINYFSYDYPRPETAEVPFRHSVAVYPTPWNTNTMLMHIGIKGHQIVTDEKPRSNLVFLIDVSGSMQSRDKLPLLKSAFRLLVDKLEPNDTVSIVTYAGNAGTVLEPTRVSDKRKILAALDRLQSGGSTAGAQGIRQAYALAEAEFDKNGINRVILATDGDFNVGISDVGQLKSYIETKRKSGVFLSVLGFGQGNYNDHLMQVLAQNGNGNAAYIDSLREAQKVLVEEAGSTLFPIASDVKIQVEFNPALVSEYRLVGYETRALKREDFNNDKVDAGDIGSGHTVTAIYELTPVGSTAQLIDGLRYQKPEATTTPPAAAPKPQDEFAFLKIRYKLPGENTSKLLTLPITRELARDGVQELSDDMRFAASVAAFGQKLRGVSYLADYDYDAILALASGARGSDPFGYRSEFLTLVRLAKSLDRSGSNDQ